MTKLSNIIPDLNPGQSGFSVGTEIVTHFNRTTDLTLTVSDVGKTIFVSAAAEINVTLPSATAIGAATHNAFGFEFVGNIVNLRDADGNLIAWFDGVDAPHAHFTPEDAVGCILHLTDASTAAGKWMPRFSHGSIYSPKLRGHAQATLTDMDVQSVVYQYGSHYEQFKGHNPVKIDDERGLWMWRQNSAGGQRARVVKLDRTTGAISFGPPVTLNATDSAGNVLGVLMQNNYGVNNTDIVLVTGVYDGSVHRAVALEIDDVTISVGTSQPIPATDDQGETVNQQFVHPALVRLSDTKAILMGRMANVTQANDNKPYAMHITLSGTPPTTVTMGTPVNFLPPPDTANYNQGYIGFHDLVTGVPDRVVWANGGPNHADWARGVVINTAGTNPAVAYSLGAEGWPIDSGGSSNNVHGWRDPVNTGRFLVSNDLVEFVYEVILGASAVTSIKLVDLSPYLSSSQGQGNTRHVGYERTSPAGYAGTTPEDWHRSVSVSHTDTFVRAMINDLYDRKRSYNIASIQDRLIDYDRVRSTAWRWPKVPWRGNLSNYWLKTFEHNRWVVLGTKNDGNGPNENLEYEFASFEIPEF